MINKQIILNFFELKKIDKISNQVCYISSKMCNVYTKISFG